MSRIAGALSAAAGGALYFLGYLGWGVWPCLFVFLAPLWWALDRTALAPALAGLVFGFVAYAGGFAWLFRLVDPFLDGNRVAGGVLWAVYGCWFAAGFAVYAVVYAAVRRRGWSVAMAGIAPLVLVEWLQPQLFPVNAGSALISVPALAQLADVGGALLLTAWLAAMNVAAYETLAWWRGRRPRPVVAWLAATALVVGALGYGRVRVADLEARDAAAPALDVGIVQANLGVMEKRTQAIVTQRRHLEQTKELLAEGPVDLVVWPETAYVRGIRRPLPVSGLPIREDVTAPLVFGASSVWEEGGRRITANSAFLIGADGTIRDAYDKNLLIPLTEYVPLARWVPQLAEWFPHRSDFESAVVTPPLHLDAWRVSTPICYEAARADFVRRMVASADPHLIVTLANDAWFGDSAEPWIHLALAQLRAVEHRRWVVRATNSGVSAIVDPVGRLVARTGLLTRENLRGEVRMLEGGTLYGRYGDWPGWVAAAIFLVALVRPRPLVTR